MRDEGLRGLVYEGEAIVASPRTRASARTRQILRGLLRAVQELIAVREQPRLEVVYNPSEAQLLAHLRAPRLQLRYEDHGPSEWLCWYELVFPIGQWDIRNERAGEDEREEPPPERGFAVCRLGCTHIGGNAVPWAHPNPAGAMPYRAGAHARWDAEVFGGLPIYVITPNLVARLVPPQPPTPRDAR